MAAMIARVLHAIIEPSALASIADDSSNYLVMARCFSPWSEPTAVTLSVCGQQYFPAGFPLLLALAGAEQSFAVAHLVVIGVFFAGLPLLWAQAAAVLRSRWLAQLVVMCFALLPGTLLGLQGILSESWYLFLSAAFFFLMGESAQPATARRAAAAGAVLGLMIGVRSIGMVMLLAMLARFAVQQLRGTRDTHPAWIVPGAAVAVAALLRILFPPASTANDYGAIWAGLLGSPQDVPGYLAGQFAALTQSWASFIALYWTDDRPLVWIAMLGLLVIVFAGLTLRLLSNRLDAWYVAGYLGVLLIWPFPGQMLRFLFPVMPLMLLQGAWLLVELARRRPSLRLVPWLAPALILAVSVPAQAFLIGRADLAHAKGLNPVYEWLRKPGADEARRELGLQNRIFEDLRELGSSLPGDAVVAFYEPSYVALIANRRALLLPYPADARAWRLAYEAGATHVLLSRIHPRLSRTAIDGLAVSGALPPQAELLGCSREPLQDLPASCLYALHP